MELRTDSSYKVGNDMKPERNTMGEDTTVDNSEEVSKSRRDEILRLQDSRKLSEFQVQQLEKNAKKNWDVFYKQNETRFFKDRHWTVREFPEILSTMGDPAISESENAKPILLELGCGVGNFLYPILEEVPNLRIWACDFSPRAIEFVKSHANYHEEKIRAFTIDLTLQRCFAIQPELCNLKADFVSLIFVLSAISPEKHSNVIENIANVTKPGSIIFFRDYGLYDMAQLRFKPGKKISDNFYFRRDGTRSYYFSLDIVTSLFLKNDLFQQIECQYVNRRTINVKEDLDVGRIYVQAKFIRKS